MGFFLIFFDTLVHILLYRELKSASFYNELAFGCYRPINTAPKDGQKPLDA